MATDAEIRAKGIKFLPLQKYLQNPYEFPVEETAPVQGGITNANAFTNSGGGNDFNPYNPDPNTVRNSSNYSPYAYRQAFGKTDYQDFDPSSTYAAKQMEMNPEYYEGKQLTGIPGAIKGYLQNSFLGKGINAIKDILPVNKRGIMHNELLGSGFQLDGTGQFVSDGGAAYKADGSNIMAGYNSYHVDRDTFTKRRKRAADNMDPNSKAFKEFNIALDAAEKNFFAAEDRKTKVYDDKSLAKDPTYKSLADLEKEKEEDLKNYKGKIIIDRFRTDKKETKDAKDAQDAQDIVDADAVKANIKKANQKGKNSPDNYGVQGLQRSGSYGGNDTYSGQGSTVSSSGDVTDSSGNYSGRNINDEFAEGGRAGYFFGGRVNYKAGGRINFRGGGADMGAPEKAAERTSRGYGTAPDTGSKSGTNDYSTTTQTQNNDRSIRDNQNPVPKESILNRTMDLGSELSYLNNLKNLNVLGIVGNIGVNKFRNYMKNKNLPEEDKFSYNTNPLPTNNYFAEVQQKDLDASKMRGFKKQDYNSYLDQMNMLNDGTKVTPYEFQGLQDGSITTTGTFTAANGGRAMFKNGGLAGLL